MKKCGLCEGVSMELSQNRYLLDFTLTNDQEPRVNASFLFGKSFILDYSHKTLHILRCYTPLSSSYDRSGTRFFPLRKVVDSKKNLFLLFQQSI